jgi:hypothetical protein
MNSGSGVGLVADGSGALVAEAATAEAEIHQEGCSVVAKPGEEFIVCTAL